MLIKDSFPGRKDGGYTRLFNNEDIGSLLSAIQASVIRSGNNLQSIIELHSQHLTDIDFDAFTNGKLINGKYLFTNSLIKTKLKVFINCTHEPDFVFVIICDKNCYIIEIKDGDTFDTKKSAGEVKHMREFAECFSNKFSSYNVFIRYCMFNQDNKKSIVDGLKKNITTDEAMTGKELCDLLGISYSNILEQRKKLAPENIDFFVEKLLDIPLVKDKIMMRI
jgi:hypothetical protein